jgi:hypothetical protein
MLVHAVTFLLVQFQCPSQQTVCFQDLKTYLLMASTVSIMDRTHPSQIGAEAVSGIGIREWVGLAWRLAAYTNCR